MTSNVGLYLLYSFMFYNFNLINIKYNKYFKLWIHFYLLLPNITITIFLNNDVMYVES